MTTFSKSSRLLSKRDFDFLREKSSKSSAKPLICFSRPSRLEGSSRLGLSVSKKIGKACLRNRLKRILREQYRNDSSARDNGLDMLFVVAQRPRKESDLRDSFSKILKLNQCKS